MSSIQKFIKTRPVRFFFIRTVDGETYRLEAAVLFAVYIIFGLAFFIFPS